ncbi:MAG: RNA polymerase sigma factor [Ruminococcus sp.]|nr:RNA polymerase sigma factor [Ruminococcus sp.]
MNDKEIIALFFGRDEKAIEYTESQYRSYCYSIADKVLRNREDSEECLNDVWLAAWNSIPPNDPPSLSTYLGRITRNLSVKRLRDINRKKRGRELTVYLEELEEAIPTHSNVEEAIDNVLLKESLEQFLKKQSKINRSLFICRYFYLDGIGEIALRFGLTENTVKLRLFRLRKKLKEYLEKEGVV